MVTMVVVMTVMTIITITFSTTIITITFSTTIITITFSTTIITITFSTTIITITFSTTIITFSTTIMMSTMITALEYFSFHVDPNCHWSKTTCIAGELCKNAKYVCPPLQLDEVSPHSCGVSSYDMNQSEGLSKYSAETGRSLCQSILFPGLSRKQPGPVVRRLARGFSAIVNMLEKL